MIFSITNKDAKTKARLGKIITSGGIIETPAFAPDATYGAVKYLSSEDLKKIKLKLVLGNIYHLSIRPGIKLIQKLGGLKKFMNWTGPLITDSGGFQVFSLVYNHRLGKITEKGINFKDHLSGKSHFLNPQKSIEDQLAIGSDILMCLDYPIHPEDKSSENDLSVKLTIKWAKECAAVFKHHPQSKNKILMAIIQGANNLKLRKQCYHGLKSAADFPGYAFGGLPLNNKILQATANLIPNHKIRYVMGSGTPQDILNQVAMGWDLFDCVIPTRNARHGLLYTFSGEIRLMQKKYLLDKKPIEAGCPCEACKNKYSRSYIRHLLKVKEPLGQRLATLHNLNFYMRLMEKIRQAIKNKQYSHFKNKLLSRYK